MSGRGEKLPGSTQSVLRTQVLAHACGLAVEGVALLAKVCGMCVDIHTPITLEELARRQGRLLFRIFDDLRLGDRVDTALHNSPGREVVDVDLVHGTRDMPVVFGPVRDPHTSHAPYLAGQQLADWLDEFDDDFGTRCQTAHHEGVVVRAELGVGENPFHTHHDAGRPHRVLEVANGPEVEAMGAHTHIQVQRREVLGAKRVFGMVCSHISIMHLELDAIRIGGEDPVVYDFAFEVSSHGGSDQKQGAKEHGLLLVSQRDGWL
jgi:hypothetical protein